MSSVRLRRILCRQRPSPIKFNSLAQIIQHSESGSSTAFSPVVVQLFLKLVAPAGRVRAITQTLQTIMLPARLSRGCSRVELCAEVEQPDVICYFEEWDEEKELFAELRVERFSRLLEVMECASERPFLEFRFITVRRGLDYIESARFGKGVD